VFFEGVSVNLAATPKLVDGVILPALGALGVGLLSFIILVILLLNILFSKYK
jgi:hypothetical protein